MLHKIFPILFLLCATLSAELKLNPLFSKGAIFQSEQPIPIWGWAEAGSSVKVSFAGHEQTSEVRKDGSWKVMIPALEASLKSETLKVSCGEEELSIPDILVGEVWLCSGQSNMEFRLNWLIKDAKNPFHQPLVELIKKEIATAEDPFLRQITVEKMVSPLEEKSSFKGEWQSVSVENNKDFSATAYFFAKELRERLKVPVGIVVSAWGGTLVEPWIPMAQYQTSTKLQKYYEKTLASVKADHDQYIVEVAKKELEQQMAAWEAKKEKAKATGVEFKQRKPRMKQDPWNSNRTPSALYNGMIAPLVPYALKGVIWYQGESNAGYENSQYREHFSALIEGWRNVWEQKNLDFYWCQLAQFKSPPVDPIVDDGWVNVCYQQFLTLNLPGTGMAVLNDIGEEKDIHPHNKMDAGKRLSNWALRQTYGMKDIVPSGPLYKEHVIEGNKVIVSFDHVGSGLMTGNKVLMEPTVETKEPLKFFQIKGADGVWKWADAKIVSKNQVEVSHAGVAQPVEVRYAWASNAKGANLYNRGGLPASLFKTVE